MTRACYAYTPTASTGAVSSEAPSLRCAPSPHDAAVGWCGLRVATRPGAALKELARLLFTDTRQAQGLRKRKEAVTTSCESDSGSTATGYFGVQAHTLKTFLSMHFGTGQIRARHESLGWTLDHVVATRALWAAMRLRARARHDSELWP